MNKTIEAKTQDSAVVAPPGERQNQISHQPTMNFFSHLPDSRWSLSAIILALILPLAAMADDFAPSSLPVGARITVDGTWVDSDQDEFSGSTTTEILSATTMKNLDEDPPTIDTYTYNKTSANTATISTMASEDLGGGLTVNESGSIQLTFNTAEGGGFTSSGHDVYFLGGEVWEDYTYTGSGSFSYSGGGTNGGGQVTRDLVAVSINWNALQGGVDFVFAANDEALGSSTTAQLFWANGTTAANKLSNTAIFKHDILVSSSGEHAPVHVPSSKFETLPDGASHILLIVDPDNLVVESNENDNNVRALQLCPFDVITHMDKPKFQKSELAPSLAQALDDFTSAVEDLDGTVTPESGYRPPEYQRHLYEIKTKFDALRASGVELQMNGNRPNLKKSVAFAGCGRLIDQINWEINKHELGKANGTVPVNKDSAHSLGLAVDLKVTLPPAYTSLDIEKLARANNLWEPYGANDRGHYELIRAPSYSLTFGGHSPINILVEDPSGRKIGFDADSNMAINQVGAGGIYSGPGSEPQIVQILPFAFLPGAYKVTGIGTGAGAYTIDVQIEDEGDPDGNVVYKVLSVGAASAGATLTPIPPINPSQNVVSLTTHKLDQGLVLFAPPWITNGFWQLNSDLKTGVWTDISQTIDPIRGFTVTNITGNGTFFRLKLP